MMLCKVSIFLAYVSSVYIIASAIYLGVTLYYNYSPFNAALEKYPELKKIKEKSALFRMRVFYSAITIASTFLVVFRPFSSCQS